MRRLATDPKVAAALEKIKARADAIKVKLESDPNYVPKVRTDLGWMTPANADWLYQEGYLRPVEPRFDGDSELVILAAKWPQLAKLLEDAAYSFRVAGVQYDLDTKIQMVRNGSYQGIRLTTKGQR